MKEIYRSCASVLVVREETSGLKILLVHKPRKNDAWQLPQGGVEKGESVVEAALRELEEEAGIYPDVLAISKQFYRYDFPSSFRHIRPDNVCGQTLQFIIAQDFDMQKVTVDDEEIDNFVWIDPAELDRYLKRKEYLSAVNKVIAEAKKLIHSS